VLPNFREAIICSFFFLKKKLLQKLWTINDCLSFTYFLNLFFSSNAASFFILMVPIVTVFKALSAALPLVS
jgi:hypothetical protein